MRKVEEEGIPGDRQASVSPVCMPDSFFLPSATASQTCKAKLCSKKEEVGFAPSQNKKGIRN